MVRTSNGLHSERKLARSLQSNSKAFGKMYISRADGFMASTSIDIAAELSCRINACVETIPKSKSPLPNPVPRNMMRTAQKTTPKSIAQCRTPPSSFSLFRTCARIHSTAVRQFVAQQVVGQFRFFTIPPAHMHTTTIPFFTLARMGRRCCIKVCFN